ncbi:NADH-ubiquinone oxidoreductase-F iron-sulfur binding region domain-containing protein [Colwellia sp. 4_MG-2023]|uniref:formate dehydrogenase beta subunit n=1 Tax=unclassified Colwellia TaxID=196834 RepID=UPI001C0A32EE|nr:MULTISPECIES: formate dehydrogenase beta subunit [unclassified Colwellia]MBU2926239.1 formate dehydrogenase [Colwellia sp. C2M11]MDO6508485.1 NADH-ubiquinone oxidoreductase-F iron-sulfur binding region domain-containing protein [Colwellia sp. 5_MG-2023]MDO6557100.1 NADH-ubiquinone oxidoreductase-F iron-sulfur binding region domain-containing protein [Colwellia sp. 4_MG-2023]MDO6652339.1 NADH-ubiquinone oxidoreductase-F iron-sulfur binding region domain-containing protein [Colwellia sp. 3_MG-
MKIFIPRESTAISLGAHDVAQAFTDYSSQHNIDISIIRNGSRGLYWLEPMIEVETPQGRMAYGPVESADVASIIEDITNNILHEKQPAHSLALGLTENIPYLKKQTRITFARTGIIDPISLADYLALDGFKGLQKSLELSTQEIVTTIVDSGLRGRGGAAFPTGIKWQTVRDATAEQKYIVCNADEGDSGTFADKLVMECDPFMLIEGMIIAGLAVGADQGYIYLRSEYLIADEILQQAIEIAYEAGYLGNNICNSGKTFNLEVRLGAEAYICGEETALLESIEGKRGLVRFKPPLPALEGLFGKPTIVNNVLSLAAVPFIMSEGSHSYQQYGTNRSRGTLPFQLAGNVKQGGLIELPFGSSLKDLIDEFSGGTASERPIKAVQVGGPLGAYLPTNKLDIPLDYEAFSKASAVLGHGGIVVFDDSVDMLEQARFSMEFCVVESCGKCTPCRIGSTRGVEVIDRIKNDERRAENMALLNDLCDTMVDGSLCAMGSMTPIPVRSAFTDFPQDFYLTTQVNNHD